jgi:hypothetical protein
MEDSLRLEDGLFWIALPILTLVFEIMAHLLICRFLIKKGTVKSTLFAYFIGLFMLLGLEMRFSVPLALDIANFVIYSASAFLYFSFFNIGETSVRIRILRELAQAPSGLSAEELIEKYSVQTMINARIERMLANGEMLLRGGRYYYSGHPKFLILAKRCQALQRLILGQQSFDPSLVIHQKASDPRK